MSIEQLRREVVLAIMRSPPGPEYIVAKYVTVRDAFDAYVKARDAASKPTFEGDEAEVRKRLAARSTVRDEFGIAHPLVNPDGPKALALLDAKDAEIAESHQLQELAKREGVSETIQRIDLLTGGDGEYRYSTDSQRNCPDEAAMETRIVKRLNEALSRAEQAEAALAERDAAIVEAVRRCDDGWAKAYIVDPLRPFLPAKPVDPLVEDEDPIDALVSLLAPVLTHGQGMAARERENRFRNALQAIKAGAADALLAQRSKQP